VVGWEEEWRCPFLLLSFATLNTMPLKMKCPGCEKVLDIPHSLAGKRGKCPACASEWQVPAPADGDQTTAFPVATTSAGTKCPGCGDAVHIPDSMLGKRVKCPACATMWQTAGPIVDAEVVPEAPQAKQEWVDDSMSNEYRLAPNQPAPYRPALRPPAQSRVYQSKSREPDTGFFAPERRGISKGVLGGFIMMTIAVVWFVAGFAAGFIFYYPPILFLIGLYALVKGVFTGNFAGED
jgi:hypothetical protein